MRDELMAGQSQCDRMFRSPPDGTAKTVLIEPKRGFYVVNREGEMKDYLRHCSTAEVMA
jgi:hypothetical protein